MTQRGVVAFLALCLVCSGCLRSEWRSEPAQYVDATIDRMWVESFSADGALLGYLVGSQLGKGYGGSGAVVGGLAGSGSCYMGFRFGEVTLHPRVVQDGACGAHVVGQSVRLRLDTLRRYDDPEGDGIFVPANDYDYTYRLEWTR